VTAPVAATSLTAIKECVRLPVADEIVGLDGSQHDKQKEFKQKIQCCQQHQRAEKCQVAQGKVISNAKTITYSTNKIVMLIFSDFYFSS
jgi:hypothetical protein